MKHMLGTLCLPPFYKKILPLGLEVKGKFGINH